MRILVAADKFKGSMTASQACAAIARGLESVFPEAKVVQLPVADGGEGTARAVCQALDGEWVEAAVHDPMGRAVTAGYALVHEDGIETAVMEMSEASGLWRLAENERDPMCASTFGTGEMILDAQSRGVQRILIGIGGSATNDGGSGMAEALGYRFFDEKRVPLRGMPVGLEKIASIESPDVPDFGETMVACDVKNPLLGDNGATRIYGPQKGVKPKDLEFLEARLRQLAIVVGAWRGKDEDFSEVPGAGAAGGLGFGLLSFCGAELAPGFDLVADALGLRAEIETADLVITGEGKIDAQTLEGKAPAGVARLAAEAGIPVAAFGGMVEDADRGRLRPRFTLLASIRDGFADLDVAECVARGEELLFETVKKSAEDLKKILRADGVV